MSKVLVIPDVHLKPDMYEKASEILDLKAADFALSLGDICDDWGQEYNSELYYKTLEAAGKFAQKYPKTLWCWGNHDLSYLWRKAESGYSFFLSGLIWELLRDWRAAVGDENKIAYVHRIDNVIFSHGGLAYSFVERWVDRELWEDPEKVKEQINEFSSDRIWTHDSPIWLRPQNKNVKMYPEGYLQVVGHTPVAKPYLENHVLNTDTFSTMPDGSAIGDRRFIVVDTEEQSWRYADEVKW